MADLYYIEEGYFDPSLGYFVYTADAAAAVTSSSSVLAVVGKNQSIDLVAFTNATLSATLNIINNAAGNLSSSTSVVSDSTKISGTSVSIDCSFSLVGNLTELLGVEIFGSGSFTSQSNLSTIGERLAGLASNLSSEVNQSTVISKTVNASSEMSSAFAQSATISHIEGADLFAFTEAAIAVQVDRLRNNNIEASAVFNIATSIERIQQGDADADAVFSAIINGLRSRDVNLETQAAFSFAATISHIEGADIQATNFASLSATITRTRDNNSSINAEATISLILFKIKVFEAAVSSQATVSANANQIKGITENLSSAFTQTGVISHIHGADITAFNTATLSATVIATKGIIQNISCQASVSTLTSVTYSQRSAMSASVRLNAAAAVLLRNITIVQNSGGDFTNIDWTTEARKFGAGSLKVSAYSYSLNHISANASINNGTDLKYFTNAYTYVSTNATTWVRYSNNLPINPTKVIWTGTQYACREGTAIYRSTDGITWTTTTVTLTDANSSVVAQGSTIEFFGGNWFIGGQLSNGVAIYRSSNLSTWTKWNLNYQSSGYTAGNGGERLWMSSVNTGSKLYFLTQVGGVGNVRQIVETSGTTWAATSMPTTYGAQVTELAFGNGLLVLASYNFSPSYNNFLHSTPVSSISWTLRRSNTADQYRKVSYVGASWFYETNAYWHAGDLTTMTPVQARSNFTNDASFPGFIDGKYVFPDSNGIQYSTSATNGYQFQTTTVNSGLPGSISYSDAANDLFNWQTMDFWVNGSGVNTASVLFQQRSTNWFMYGSLLNNYFSVYFQGTNGDTRFNIYHTGSPGGNLYNTGGWNHIRISRNSSTGAVAVFCNGTKVTGIYTSGTFPESANTPIRFGGSIYVTSSVYFDEFLVSDQLITDTSSTTYTVPTTPWSSNSNTDLLLHFDNSITDDSRFQVVPTAFISSVATVSAGLTGSQKASAAIQSTATLTAIATGVVGANLVAFSDAALTTTANRIRDNNSAIVSTADVVADEDRFRDVDSAISDSFSITAGNERLRNNSITTQSAFTQTSTINKIGSAVVSVESQSNVTAYITRIQEILLIAFNTGSLSADVNVIRSAESNQSCQATVDTTVVKTVFGASQQTAESSVSTFAVLTRSVIILTESIASEVAVVVATRASLAELVVAFTLSAVADANTKQGASSLSSSSTLSANAVKTAEGTSSLEIQVSQDSTISKTTGYSSALSTVSTVYILASVAGKIEMIAFTNASLNLIVSITREISLALSSQTTFVANTFDSLAKQASATITSTATQSAVVAKRVNPTFAFESIAIELAVVFKAASGDIDLASAFSVSADVEVTRGVSALINSAATVSSLVVKTARTTASITSQFTQTATVTRIRSASITTEAIASTLTAVVRIARFFINCDLVSTVAVSGKVIRGARSSLTANATFTVATVKLVITTAAITSRANVSATVGIRKRFTAVFASAMSFVVELREIRLDEIVYVIPGENYTYTIISETRIHDIYGETRIRSVTGESRIRTIQGESRIHTT